MVNPVATVLFEALLAGAALFLFATVLRSFLPPFTIALPRRRSRPAAPGARPVVGQISPMREELGRASR